MVRRIKEDLREIQGGFPKRHVEQITLRNLPPETPELQLASLLSHYQEIREQRLGGESKRVQAASGLLLCHLQQRLFSSVEAFARTLKVHRRTVEKQRQTAVKIETASLDLLSGGVGADDDRATLARPSWLQRLTARWNPRQRQPRRLPSIRPRITFFSR